MTFSCCASQCRWCGFSCWGCVFVSVLYWIGICGYRIADRGNAVCDVFPIACCRSATYCHPKTCRQSGLFGWSRYWSEILGYRFGLYENCVFWFVSSRILHYLLLIVYHPWGFVTKSANMQCMPTGVCALTCRLQICRIWSQCPSLTSIENGPGQCYWRYWPENNRPLHAATAGTNNRTEKESKAT